MSGLTVPAEPNWPACLLRARSDAPVPAPLPPVLLCPVAAPSSDRDSPCPSRSQWSRETDARSNSLLPRPKSASFLAASLRCETDRFLPACYRNFSSQSRSAAGPARRADWGQRRPARRRPNPHRGIRSRLDWRRAGNWRHSLRLAAFHREISLRDAVEIANADCPKLPATKLRAPRGDGHSNPSSPESRTSEG